KSDAVAEHRRQIDDGQRGYEKLRAFIVEPAQRYRRHRHRSAEAHCSYQIASAVEWTLIEECGNLTIGWYRECAVAEIRSGCIGEIKTDRRRLWVWIRDRD